MLRGKRCAMSYGLFFNAIFYCSVLKAHGSLLKKYYICNFK